jgi:hypothetical protein
MRKRVVKRTPSLPVRFSLSLSNKKEREIYLASIRQLDEQSGRLGIFDPPDTEPAILYSPMEEKE